MTMRRARVLVHAEPAAVLEDLGDGRYTLTYDPGYRGEAVSLALPVTGVTYAFDGFPPFFDGLLPEGRQLDALLRQAKLDARDYFGQIVAVGADVVGAVTVEALPDDGPTNETVTDDAPVNEVPTPGAGAAANDAPTPGAAVDETPGT